MRRRKMYSLIIQLQLFQSFAVDPIVNLSVSRDGYVHFGDKVNIRCPGALDKTRNSAHNKPRADCNIDVLPHNNKVLCAETFEGQCGETGSSDCKTNLGSTFVIKSIDGSSDGEQLKYSQPFYISTMDNEGSNLFLTSERVTVNNYMTRSHHQEVSLVDKPSANTEWQILHKDPKTRMEVEFSPVLANDVVVIHHVRSNQHLHVEEGLFQRTSFGTREYKVAVFTSLDSNKDEMEQNHWVLDIAVPGQDTQL